MRFFSCSVTSLWLWLWIASFRRLDGQKLEPVEADENGNHDDDDKWLIPFIVSSIRSSSSPHPSPDNGATADGFVWHNLSVHTRRRHGGADGRGMTILHPSSFVVRNGQVTGLLGPSGSGKSTLLSVFAGSCPLFVHGYVGGFSVSSPLTHTNNELHGNDDPILYMHEIPAQQVAYLQQHDDFFTQLTVQETLDLAAYLEMPHLNAHERNERIRQTVSYLGLSHCTHRPIGSVTSSPGGGGGGDTSAARFLFRNRKRIATPETSPSSPTNPDPYNYHATPRGGRLSGGERRRLSVALELLTTKELLLADEPTSGLDAAYSVVVMKLLGDLARSRHIPAIISLHQPRSSIWMNLDALILLAPGGKVCYAGPRENAVSYFQSLGYKLPANTNPAEFLVDLVSIDSEDAEQAVRDLERIDELAAHFEAYQQDLWKKQSYASHRISDIQFRDTTMIERGKLSSRSRSIWRWIPRMGALLRRSWRQNVRDVHLNLFRFLANIGNAMLLAGIFPTVQGPIPSTSSIADRVALLSFGAINLCMLAYMKTIHLFAQERPVIEREQIRDQYTAAEYLLAKVLAEIPLDAGFSMVFTTVLKKCTGLQISWKRLSSIFSLLTTAGASMGFFVGSLSPSEQYASSAGIPMLVVLMIVGVINPSGVDPTKPKPLLVRWVKELSPFASAIEALCIGEYPGVRFQFPKRGPFERVRNIPRMGGLALVTTGDQVIEALGLQDVTYGRAMKHLAILAGGYTVASWFGLMIQQQRRRRVKLIAKPTSSTPPDRNISNNRIRARIPTRVRF